MKSKINLALMMFALIVGLSLTVSAQTRSRTQYDRGRTIFQNNRPDFHRKHDRGYRLNEQRDWRRNNDRWWHMQKQSQVFHGRTYRLPNGRWVTILPNGRRIYR